MDTCEYCGKEMPPHPEDQLYVKASWRKVGICVRCIYYKDRFSDIEKIFQKKAKKPNV